MASRLHAQPKRPTPTQRRALTALAGGARIIDDGSGGAVIVPGNARLAPQTVRSLVRNKWVTEPQPPFFDNSTAGTITHDGRVNIGDL